MSESEEKSIMILKAIRLWQSLIHASPASAKCRMEISTLVLADSKIHTANT